MTRFLLIVFLLVSGWSCAKELREARLCAQWTAENVVYAAKGEAKKSMEADSSSEKVRYAKRGLNWAEKCVASFPKEAGCYFYRAVTRGLYTESTMIKFQKAIKKMIADGEKVIALDKTYDHGGAYRILGNQGGKTVDKIEGLLKA